VEEEDREEAVEAELEVHLEEDSVIEAEGGEEEVDSVAIEEVVAELEDEVDPLDEAVEVELDEEAPVVEREELERKEHLKLSLNLTDIPVFSLPRVKNISSSLATLFPENQSTERSVSLSNNLPPMPTRPQRKSNTVFGILSVPSWQLVFSADSTTFTSVLERRSSTSVLLQELQYLTLPMSLVPKELFTL